ncbi:hypothetical protein [Streptomyces sp. NPDC006334]|uniref:hypothetical protein n=1 Tax=Streptomyces sp. NPDC006334 TaxID=3156754 RepID=UPI0033A48301
MSDTVQGDTTRMRQTGETAKAEASATAGQAKQAAGQVAGTAVDQAKTVAGEARQQVGAAAGDLRSRAMDEVQGQTRRAAGTLHHWADDLAGLADNAPGDSPARSLATRAADGGHRAADYLEKQGVQGVLSDVQGFARRRPGAFLGGALLAGMAVGRLMKVAAKADMSSGADTSSGTGRRELAADTQQMTLSDPTAAVPAASATDVAQTATPAAPAVPEYPPSVGAPSGDVPGRPVPGV